MEASYACSPSMVSEFSSDETRIVVSQDLVTDVGSPDIDVTWRVRHANHQKLTPKR